MTRNSHLDLAEDVALVTFALIDALDGWCEALLPGSYRYHLFGGFPGFCDFAGAAGLALSEAFADCDRDQWIDIADGFAAVVSRHSILERAPLDCGRLRAQAEAAREQAISDGLANPGEVRP